MFDNIKKIIHPGRYPVTSYRDFKKVDLPWYPFIIGTLIAIIYMKWPILSHFLPW